MPAIDYEQTGNDVILPVQAQPKARRNAIVGVHAGRLKIAVTQAPEKGKANEAIVKVLAAAVGLKKSQIQLITGSTNPLKKFRITDIDIDELTARINAVLSKL